MNETVRAMLEDDRAPTAPLTDFRPDYDENDNLWWMLDSGHMQNLFEAACEEIDRLRSEVSMGAALRDRLRADLSDCRKGITRWPS